MQEGLSSVRCLVTVSSGSGVGKKYFNFFSGRGRVVKNLGIPVLMNSALQSHSSSRLEVPFIFLGYSDL